MITVVPGSLLLSFLLHFYDKRRKHTPILQHTRAKNSPAAAAAAYPLCLSWLDLWRSHVYPERYRFEKPPSRVVESNVCLFFVFSFYFRRRARTRALCAYANRLANTVSHCLFLKMMQLARHPFFCWCSRFPLFYPPSLSFSGCFRARGDEGGRRGGGGGQSGACCKSTKVL